MLPVPPYPHNHTPTKNQQKQNQTNMGNQHHHRRRSSLHLATSASLDVNLSRRVSHTSERVHYNHHRSSHETSHRILITRSPQPAPTLSGHEYCLSMSASYARLSARLDRLKGHRTAVAAHVGEGRRGLEGVLAFLSESLREVERELEEKRERVLREGEGKGGKGWFGVGVGWERLLI